MEYMKNPTKQSCAPRLFKIHAFREIRGTCSMGIFPRGVSAMAGKEKERKEMCADVIESCVPP